MMRRSIRASARLAAVLSLLALACAHAQTAIGNRDPDAQPDPETPEVNCKLYTTVDCRPAQTR